VALHQAELGEALECPGRQAESVFHKLVFVH
jgi:hypothetical protein